MKALNTIFWEVFGEHGAAQEFSGLGNVELNPASPVPRFWGAAGGVVGDWGWHWVVGTAAAGSPRVPLHPSEREFAGRGFYSWFAESSLNSRGELPLPSRSSYWDQ